MLELIVLFVSLLVIYHYKFRGNMVDLLQNLHGVYNRWENRNKSLVDGGVLVSGTKSSVGDGGDCGFVQKQRKISPPQSPTTPPVLPTSSRTIAGRRPSHDVKRKISTGSMRNPSFYLNQSKSDTVGQFKITQTLMPDSNSRPFMGNVCTKCSTSTKRTSLDEMQQLGLGNLLKVPTSNRDRGFFTRLFHHLVHVWIKEADFHYASVTKSILGCERVKIAIESAATRDMEELGLDSNRLRHLLRKHEARAAKVLKSMKANISSVLIRITAWVLFKVLGRLLTAIQVHKGQLEIVKRFSRTNVPVIYLPLHRSHLDYILVTFILFNEEIKAPLVAAGDNLRIPLFGPIMRGLGAYFIKRKLDPKDGKRDFVYRAVLHNYMVESLAAGHSMEFFIEGGRSRSGKACLPKGGLLSIVVNSLLDGIIEDAYVVPVGISYEKLLDGSFISEQMGKDKVTESLSSAVKGIWNVFRANYGSVRVDFAHPFSLREFVHAAQTYAYNKPRSLLGGPEQSPSNILRSISSTASLYGTDVVIEDQRLLVKGLAEHALYDAVQSTALMSTNVVAFILLNKYRKGVMLRSLVQDFDWVCDEIRMRGRDLGFTGNGTHVVSYALNLLGPTLVTLEATSDGSDSETHLTFIKPVLTLPKVLELNYYSNVTLSVFLKDAILACALNILVGDEIESLRGVESEVWVSKQQLKEKALDLCDVLQYEFILTPPCTTLESSINDKIEDFIVAEMLSSEADVLMSNENSEWNGRRIPRRMEWEGYEDEEEDDEFTVDQQRLKVNLRGECVDRLRFFRNIIAPFIDGYWHLGTCLKELVDNEVEENEFVRVVQKNSMEKIHQGLVRFEECLAAEIIRNGLRLFSNWKVVNNYLQGNVKVIYLTENYNSEERISLVLDILEEFRK